jgi:hypothetical protein
MGSFADQIIMQPCANPGLPGSYFNAKTSTVIASVGGTFVLPAGAYLFIPVTSVAVQIQDPLNTWTSIEATATGFVQSDGANIRLQNNTAGSATALYYQIR